MILMDEPTSALDFSNRNKDGKVEAFGKSDEVLTEDLLYLLYGEKTRVGEIEGHRVFYREVF